MTGAQVALDDGFVVCSLRLARCMRSNAAAAIGSKNAHSSHCQYPNASASAAYFFRIVNAQESIET